MAPSTLSLALASKTDPLAREVTARFRAKT
jgi:hypothetical protein